MIGFESDEIALQKLRKRLQNMTDEELIKFGKSVATLSNGPIGTSNPFKRQLDEAERNRSAENCHCVRCGTKR